MALGATHQITKNKNKKLNSAGWWHLLKNS